ncbi:hypothetical protein AAHE18_10G198100 [Arachis hypogaea]
MQTPNTKQFHPWKVVGNHLHANISHQSHQTSSSIPVQSDPSMLCPQSDPTCHLRNKIQPNEQVTSVVFPLSSSKAASHTAPQTALLQRSTRQTSQLNAVVYSILGLNIQDCPSPQC